MHQNDGKILCIIIKTQELPWFKQAEQVMDITLATCVHALKCTITGAIKTSSGDLVF